MIVPRWFLRRRTEKYVQLANRDEIRAIGPLAEALRSWDPEVQQIAEAALVRLLPRLKESDTRLLNAEQRRCLNRALRGKNADLIVAILKAQERIGDEESLPNVVRLATLSSRTANNIRIRHAAMECLPFLEERLRMKSAVETLLRASAETQHPESYLRPSAPPCVPADALRQSEK